MERTLRGSYLFECSLDLLGIAPVAADVDSSTTCVDDDNSLALYKNKTSIYSDKKEETGTLTTSANTPFSMA